MLGRWYIRTDTAANWASTNPVLAVGEAGWDTTNKVLKIGDGSTAWSSLTIILDFDAGYYMPGGTDVAITDGGTGVSTLPSGILKGAGTGAITAATAGTDYYNPGGTDVAVGDGGTGRSTGTTAYSLVATGTTATGAQQTLANGATTTILVGGGASALPIWTTATGSGAPVRATSPALVTPALGTPTSGTLTSCTGLPIAGTTDGTRALVWTGAAWPDRPADSKVSVFTGETSTAPTDTDLAVGDVWVSPAATLTVAEGGTSVATLPANQVLIGNGTSAVTGIGPSTAGYILGTSDGTTWAAQPLTRVNSTASSATPAINTDTTDQFNITALAAAITSMTSGLTGTPRDGQSLMIRIKDNGTARTIAWGTSFVSSGVATLLATTVISKTHMVGLKYDSTAAKWVCMAVDATGY